MQFCMAILMGGMLCMPSVSTAKKLEFTLHQQQGDQSGPTLLVIGGIQGDEPGGFNAAALLVTDYHITHGQVWVVPNLNFESIIQRSRGVYGDMNRKFLTIPKSDPEYAQIERIKSIILNKQVDLILNLHDGSGFYTPHYVNPQANPDRWGQSVIIDQESVPGIAHGDLGVLARTVISQVNNQIDNPAHYYHLRNTKTAQGDMEMEKTLSYFAVRNGKSAFGVEASKEFLTHQRVRFHLMIVEAFMQKLGIQYTRDFELTANGVQNRIDSNVRMAMFDNRIYLDMTNARRTLRYLPIKKDAPLEVIPGSPLIAVIDKNNDMHVRYGNRYITHLLPFYTEYDESLHTVPMLRDAQRVDAELGTVVEVQNSFRVEPPDGYRINVIGFKQVGKDDDGHVTIRRRDIMPSYSVDRAGRLYRVEVYHGDKFCGMVLVRFALQPLATLPTESTTEPETSANGT